MSPAEIEERPHRVFEVLPRASLRLDVLDVVLQAGQELEGNEIGTAVAPIVGVPGRDGTWTGDRPPTVGHATTPPYKPLIDADHPKCSGHQAEATTSVVYTLIETVSGCSPRTIMTFANMRTKGLTEYIQVLVCLLSQAGGRKCGEGE